MTATYGAFCTDFYINVKLGMKLELAQTRESVLSLFERVRRQYPAMSEFRKYRDELALETPTAASPHRWVAVRSTSVRSGVVNPARLADAYRLHKAVLETSPYFLSISPLDVDFVEVLFGFDLAAGGNQDSIVGGTLLNGSPLAGLLDVGIGRPIDCQPVLGFMLDDGAEAYFEVKTRTSDARREKTEEPISVFLTVRRQGPTDELGDLGRIYDSLASQGEELVETRVLPTLVNPIRESIVPGL